jgi:hypothetical protein
MRRDRAVGRVRIGCRIVWAVQITRPVGVFPESWQR